MAATAAASRCLLQLILVSSSAVTSTGRRHERQLQVFSQVVSGPAQGRLLVLHLDGTLPAHLRRTVVGVEALQHKPHLSLILGLNHSWWRPRQESTTAAPLQSFSSSFTLHVVLWFTPRPELLQALRLQWKPRNLLLFSIGSSSITDMLRDETLNNVEKLALIEQISAKTDRDPDTQGVYTVLPFSAAGVQFLGPWKHESFGSWDVLFPDRFPSFEGYTFHLATWMIEYPYLYRKNASLSPNTGISIRMLEILSSVLNFTYTLTVEPPEPAFGNKVNGSWDGILGMIHKREKNFTVNPLFLTLDRFMDFDTSTYLTFADFKAFLLTPKPLPISINIPRPFTFGVWAAIVFSFAVTVFFLLMLEKTAGVRGLAECWETCVWLLLHRGLVGQSAPVLPRATWQRVFLSVWLICCLVAITAYTSNLVGFFTRLAYPRRIHTLQELTDSDFRLAKHDVGGVINDFIKKPPSNLYRKSDLFPRYQDVVEAMLAGTHAFFGINDRTRFMLSSYYGVNTIIAQFFLTL